MRKEFGKAAGIAMAVWMGASLAACGQQAVETVPDQEAEIVVETEEVYEEPEEEVAEVVEEAVEEPDDTDEEQQDTDDDQGTEGLISFEDVEENFNALVDLFNEVSGMYQSDNVPQDDEVEKILARLSGEIDEISELLNGDLPTDDDKMNVLTRIGSIGEELRILVDPIMEAAEAEDAYYQQLVEVVQDNFDYMNKYFDAAWDYFSKNGGSDAQIQTLLDARDEIGVLDDLSTATSEELKDFNDRINYVLSILEALHDSI